MSVAYQFNKKIIGFMVSLFVFSLVMAYVAGLVTGISMDRPGEKVTARIEREKEDSEIMTENTADKQKKASTGLINQTENNPVSPEFKESSPVAEKPELSAPK